MKKQKKKKKKGIIFQSRIVEEGNKILSRLPEEVYDTAQNKISPRKMDAKEVESILFVCF